VVSDLLDSDMNELLSIDKIDEDSLDEIYDCVQKFIEREVPDDQHEDEDSNDDTTVAGNLEEE